MKYHGVEVEDRSGAMVTCRKCGGDFVVLRTEDEALAAAKRAGRKRFLVRCMFCKQMTDALARPPKEKVRRGVRQDRRLFRCPEPNCSGWVCWVDHESPPFWGCGECGETYEDEQELFAAIDWAVKHLRHRRRAWRKTKRGWTPSALGNADTYEERVEAEPLLTRAEGKARRDALREAQAARARGARTSGG